MSIPLLQIHALVSGYGKLAIVQNVSLNVEEGEIVALIGPNGSGKSTLVKSVFGLTNIFDGKVIFDGREITRLNPEDIARKGLAYVPQISNIFPDLTVNVNLRLGAIPDSHDSDKHSRYDAITKLFPALMELRNRKASTLSGGQRQMLAIARALMANPKMLILDEPAAALAPIVAQNMFNQLRQISNEGKTLIVVEQSARQALRIADRGVVMVQGRIAFEGTPDQISKDEEIIRIYLGLVG